MHGGEKTKIVAQSLQAAADWIERVAREASAERVLAPALLLPRLRVRCKGAALLSSAPAAGGHRVQVQAAGGVCAPAGRPSLQLPSWLVQRAAQAALGRSLTCPFLLPACLSPLARCSYLFPHTTGESPLPTSAKSALKKEFEAAHRWMVGLLLSLLLLLLLLPLDVCPLPSRPPNLLLLLLPPTECTQGRPGRHAVGRPGRRARGGRHHRVPAL